MKKSLLLATVGFASMANAAELFNNGPVFDVPGSPNLSQLISPNSTFGFGAQKFANNGVADDFSVAGPGWNVDRLTFYMYQSFASGFTFTDIDYQITSSHGDAISWTTAASIANGGLVAYRVTSTTLGNRDRAIYAIDVPVNFTLAPGAYVLRWRAAGSAASGPWQPPTVPTTGGGNATQSLAGGAFAPLIDAGGQLGVELPFSIGGTRVPTPGALAVLGLGGLVAGRRRR